MVGLPGRPVPDWDSRIRPQPKNSRLISLSQSQEVGRKYDVIICHNITNLLQSKMIKAPKILILHGTLEGRFAIDKTQLSKLDFQNQIKNYVSLMNIHVMSVSELKAKSWGLDCEIIKFGVNVENYFQYQGLESNGLRIVNNFSKRKDIVLWDFYQKSFGGMNIKIVGINPDLKQAEPSKSWDHLKKLLVNHRYYVHTADPILEDGYNMSVVEAMASGMPILANINPSSPIESGVEGFASDDPNELKRAAIKLTENHALAKRLGAKAKEKVNFLFPLEVFENKMISGLEYVTKQFK